MNVKSEYNANADRTPARLNGFSHSGRLIYYDCYDKIMINVIK
ncbi:MAG: hypothetical protein JWO06_3117 [Bacteroidota bacterium]|nr:hypothetical protein [Bacteroidota bacterium]